jgi:hypothetical protein
MQTMADYDILKLLLPVFLSPKNYDEMLKKLAAFLFYETWLMRFVLRGIPIVDTAFRSVESFEALGTASPRFRIMKNSISGDLQWRF